MSELKAYIGPHPTDHTLTDYYLKSEADKVIAYHKYKRCLAMAEECHALYDKYSMLAADDTNWEEEDYYFARWRFFEKWKYKWLELADKFKEAK